MRLAPLVAAVLTVALAACGSRGLNFMSPQQENEMGTQAYSEMKGKEKLCQDAATNAYVARVAQRLQAIANKPDFQWEVTVFDNDSVNAWCLPGGKIGIYTGILPYCQNEAGLAAVMGHEIAHATERHGGQRMTSQAIAGIAGQTLGAYLQSQQVNPTTTNLAMVAFGAGTQIGVLLPFGRDQETEADGVGVRLMAQAGYDPAEATLFWDRFAQLSGGGPKWLSTHPPSSERAAKLRGMMGEANQLYQAAPQKHGAGEPVPAAYRTPKAAPK